MRVATSPFTAMAAQVCLDVVQLNVRALRRGTDREKHVKHLARFVSMAFGKPGARYNFSKEGVDNLTKAHANMGITAEHFTIVASHLQKCMEARCAPLEC